MRGFIPYIPAGYPDMEVTVEILEMLNTLPVKGVEVGVPFSDPVADGPVIQMAHKESLDNNTTLEEIIYILSDLSLNYELYIMSYLNPIIHYPYGLKKLLREFNRIGVQGLIIPDLPLKEIHNVRIDYPIVPFVAPNTKGEELDRINKIAPPFVYYISRYGVTGACDDLPFVEHMKKVKQKVKAPLFIGFGISTLQQVRAAWKIADGVVVGSALVKIMGETPRPHVATRIRLKIEELMGL